jgi:CO dehydrogenase/acetyl-CoA synthase epsilon subunit
MLTENQINKNLEKNFESITIKVTKETICQLRAEAERQKIQKAEKLAMVIGNNGKDLPSVDIQELAQMEDIMAGFEITEGD